MIPKNSLIYDIETATNGASFQELQKHKLRFFGAYSYQDDKYYYYNYKEKSKIQALINRHKFLIGFNNKYYDNPILEQEGINLNYKVMIDLQKIIKQRQNSVKWGGSVLAYHLRDNSLDTITRTLNLVDDSSAKGEMDYDILNKKTFTQKEYDDIKKYTLRDIEITKKLFDWTFNQFDNWGHHLSKRDQQNLVHITCSPSVYSYKLICERTGLKEIYSNNKEKNDLDDGAYVAYPTLEKAEGNIYCLDFASLYPHIMIQCNVYGRNKTEDIGWHGYEGLETLGFYDDKNMSKICKVIWEMYKERKTLKGIGDPREYGLKIAMNIIYGLLRSSLFKSVYDEVGGNDVCIIGQEWIKFARKKFEEHGYNVFYVDTDSLYFHDKFLDKEKFMKLKDEIMKEIKSKIPFPVDTFDMDIDYEIDMIHFFKPIKEKKKDEPNLDEKDIEAKKLGLLKKNYIFIYDKKGKKDLFIKNLGIVKRSNTPLSKKIFYEKMKPIILSEHRAKFPDAQIREWVKEYLEENIELFAKRITVKHINSYKSKNCIQAQVYNYIPQGEKYPLGHGTYFLIPNKKIGVGKGIKKYCTLDEYKKNLNYNDLYLDVVMTELAYFNEDFVLEKIKKEKIPKFIESLRQEGLW